MITDSTAHHDTKNLSIPHGEPSTTSTFWLILAGEITPVPQHQLA